MEQFDDVKLKGIAKAFYSVGKNSDTKVDLILDKPKLLDSDRNYLLEFIEKNRYSGRPISMSQMKREILQLIGYKGQVTEYAYSTSTVGRQELEEIYNFVKALKK